MARFSLLSIFGTLYRQAWHTSKYKNSSTTLCIQYLLHNEAKTHCPNGKKSHQVQATSLNINMDIGEYIVQQISKTMGDQGGHSPLRGQ